MGLTDRQLSKVRRVLELPEWEPDLKGWAIVTAPGGRWFGKIDRRYEIDRASWRELARVDLSPAFIVGAPEAANQIFARRDWAMSPITQKYEVVRDENQVGTAISSGIYPPSNAGSFHPVKGIVVSAIEYAEDFGEAMRSVMLKEILAAVDRIRPDEASSS